MNIISMPSNQFRLIDSGRVANSGSLYIGKINTDPTVLSNQLPVTALKADGTTSSISQPIALDSNGLPMDSSGNVITLSVETHYSLAVFDAYGKLQQNIAALFIKEIGSFAALRNLPVIYEGQEVKLVGWNTGSIKGGGIFIGRKGTATDDGGYIAAGNGYYWERVNDKDYVDPVDFGAVDVSVNSTYDSGPAFRNAIKAAVRLARSEVSFIGNYLITSTDDTGWILPFDDGTLSPSRAALIAQGLDSVLPSEEQIKMSIHISLPYGINITSKDISSNSITFGWDKSTVNTQQSVAIVGRVKGWDGTYVAALGSKNRMYGGVTRNNFNGFTIKSAFIGYISDGISQFFDWGRVGFEQCAYCALFQGIDLSKIEYLSIKASYCGLVSGGWWLQRNGGAYPGTALPPYPSSGGDIQSLGWTDFLSIKELFFNPPLGKWDAGSIWEKIDNFFDTYFYKSANTIKTSDGGTGRLSSTLQDLTSDAYAKYASLLYRGVASRAFVDFMRHPRDNQGNEILRVKIYGSHRIPILTPDTGDKIMYGNIHYAYVERTPYYDTSTTSKTVTNSSGATVSNDFYTMPQNNWNVVFPYESVNATLYTSAPGLAIQGIMSVQKCSPVNSIVAKGSSLGVFGTNGRLTQFAVSPKMSDFNGTPAADFMASDSSGNVEVMLRCFNDRNYTNPLTFRTSGTPAADNREKFFTSLAFSGDQYSGKTILLGNGVTDGSSTFSPISYLINTEEERSKFTINVLLQLPNNTAPYTGTLYFPLDLFPTPLLTIQDKHVGPYAPIFNLYRFLPSATAAAGFVPTSVQILKGDDNKYYVRFGSGYWPSQAVFLKGSDLTGTSYFGFTMTYIKLNYL